MKTLSAPVLELVRPFRMVEEEVGLSDRPAFANKNPKAIAVFDGQILAKLLVQFRRQRNTSSSILR